LSPLPATLFPMLPAAQTDFFALAGWSE